MSDVPGRGTFSASFSDSVTSHWYVTLAAKFVQKTRGRVPARRRNALARNTGMEM